MQHTKESVYMECVLLLNFFRKNLPGHDFQRMRFEYYIYKKLIVYKFHLPNSSIFLTKANAIILINYSGKKK